MEAKNKEQYRYLLRAYASGRCLQMRGQLARKPRKQCFERNVTAR